MCSLKLLVSLKLGGTVGGSKGVQLEVFGDRQGGAFGGPKGVQLEGFHEFQAPAVGGFW